ncbi:hypothetical protein G7046_g9946 [Stylonectria norvegica]|nr:hypothetical protein G7046_g9946 [Stylonectria norvegica]
MNETVTPGTISTPLQSEQSKRYEQEVVKSLALVVLEPADQPRFLGTSSGVALAKVVMASIGCSWPDIPPPTRNPALQVCSTKLKSSLPPRQAAAHLIDVYFQCRTPHFPVLDRANIDAAVHTAYSVANDNLVTLPRESRRHIFVAFMVFAISLCGLQTGLGDRPVESEGCYHSALLHIDCAISYAESDIETLRNILLLTQYISLSPSKGNLWLLTGLALRISINIGLHWETETSLSFEKAQLNERRRLFWAVYHLDRLLVITLGRPFSLEEQGIEVGFPDLSPESNPATDVHFQLVANHLIRLERLESEIKHVLYRHQKRFSLAYPRPDYALWAEDIKPRLEEWRNSIPSPQDAHPESIYAFESWWEAIYSNTLMLLHRPNPVMSVLSAESLRICFDAATKLIMCIRTLQREHRLEMVWLWAQRLFVAGLTLIYAIWNSDELRTSHPPGEIVNTAQTCATTLAVLTEKFPSAAGCRDALETLVSATVRALFDPQSTAFAKNNGVQPSATGNADQAPIWPSLHVSPNSMYSMLPEEMFGMGYGVSSAPTGWLGLSAEFTYNLIIATPL